MADENEDQTEDEVIEDGDEEEEVDTDPVNETEKAIRKKMLDQIDQTALTASQKISETKQKVKKKELIDSTDTDIPARKTPAADKIDLKDYDQTSPDTIDAATYASTDASPNIGDATAAKGKVSKKAVMDAEQGTVSPDSIAIAATAELDPRATTQYQMGELMSSIKAGQPLPAWAAPQVRKVTAIMQQRGLGASSMAAAAMVQAVTESGIQIAAQDAGKYATIQLSNLSNEQQAALQKAATFAAMDMANLNNRQQAAIQNSKTFLTMDMANLTNEQQANAITYQSQVSGFLADAAAENASKQFNAKSENEVDMFFAELGATIKTTSLNRKAGLEQYNVSQKVAVDQFNAQMKTTRDQFNANMTLQIDQSNVNWRRTVNTNNTAATNEANRQNVLNLLGINQNAMNNIWQTYRDQASWNMKSSENAKDRAHNAAMQSAAIAADKDMYDTKYDDYLVNEVIDNIFG